MPRGGSWRPGARWARSDPARADVAGETAAVPMHQRPSMREMGRRSEAAEHPFRRQAAGPTPTPAVPNARATSRPLILVHRVGQREVVTASCPAALALGLMPGMPAVQARALVPNLDVRPAEPDQDAAFLDRLALHAVRCWTPTAAPSDHDGLWLDLTGVAHLFGGEDAFCRRLVRFLGRLGLTARIAVAGTAGAAHAAARYMAQPIALVPAGGEAEAIAPLPLAALRLESKVLGTASRFGLDRVGDIMSMPRGPLGKRLGSLTVVRLDQALGRVAEPITGVRPFEPPAAERGLLEPIGTAEAIGTVLSHLVSELVEQLRARGLGLRVLRLDLDRVDGTAQSLVLGTSRPTRDVAHLMRMLLLRIDAIEPGFGIERVRLAAIRAEGLGPATLGAVLAGEDETPDLAQVVDRLAGRVGEDALFRAAPVETDVPERAVARVPPLCATGSWPTWARPARILSRPEPLARVVALLPDHPPRRFDWRGRTHKIIAGDGPERIHGEWWRREGEVWAVRDYFRVEDEQGGRYWVFRRGDGADASTGDLSWHMHGMFG